MRPSINTVSYSILRQNNINPHLGTQLGDDRSISQVAKRFMGTGMLPEPRTTALANTPVGRVVGAGPPPPPLLGFRKAARTPPLSTAAAIITSTAWGAALTKCRSDAGAAELCAACSCSCSSDSQLLYTDWRCWWAGRGKSLPQTVGLCHYW